MKEVQLNDTCPNESASGVDSNCADSNVEPPKKRKFWRRLLKTAAITLGCMLSVLLILIIILVSFRDRIIKTVITQGGSWATGLEITMDKFETSLTDGELIIVNLKITNPAQFEKPYLLELDSFFISLDINSLNQDEIVVKSIEVDGLKAVAEFNDSGKFNVVALAENLEQKFPPAENEPEPSEKPAKSIIIESIAIRDSNAIVYDDRIGIPTFVPLVYNSNNLSFETSNESLIQAFDSFASSLEYACSGVANAGELVLDTGKLLINSTGDAGKKLIDTTGDAGKKLLDTTGDAGKKLIDTTGDAGKQLHKSGKKLLDAFGL